MLELGARYSLEELAPAFGVMSVWFANGHDMLEHVRGKLAGKRLGGAGGALLAASFRHGRDRLVRPRSRASGVGFSPGDNYCDEPHFYLTIYPEPSIPGLPLLPRGRVLAHVQVPRGRCAGAQDRRGDKPDQACCENFFDVAIGGALAARK